jgi:hypothetical protein
VFFFFRFFCVGLLEFTERICFCVSSGKRRAGRGAVVTTSVSLVFVLILSSCVQFLHRSVNMSTGLNSQPSGYRSVGLETGQRGQERLAFVSDHTRIHRNGERPGEPYPQLCHGILCVPGMPRLLPMALPQACSREESRSM